MTGTQEQAIALGPRRSLCGIITPAAEPLAGAPMIVLLNAGILHRVGANRLHVTIARRLAAKGYTVVRMDLSGIGDSAPREEGGSLFEAALADIRDALDTLEQARGASRFIIGGLCSGAMHSLGAAHADQRVVGAIMLDLFIPRTRRFYVHYFLGKSLNVKGAWRLVTGRHPVWRRFRRRLGLATPGPEPRPGRDQNIEQIRGAMTIAFNTAIERGVRLLAVFTDGHPGEHNYRRQLLDAFSHVRFGRALRLEYMRGSDHTFTLRRNQERLIHLLSDWLADEFPGQPAIPPRPAAPATAPAPDGGGEAPPSKRPGGRPSPSGMFLG